MMNGLAVLVPYAAVLIGMTLFKSAWLAVGLYHLGVLTFFALRGAPRDLWSGARNPILLPATIACACAAPLIYFMWPFFAASENILPTWLAEYGLVGGAWLALIPYFSIVHPILEEAHWRASSPPDAPLFWWGDAVFAGYHVLVLHRLMDAPWLVFVFGGLVGASMFWRWSRARFGGCATAVITHAAADAGVMIGVIFLLRS